MLMQSWDKMMKGCTCSCIYICMTKIKHSQIYFTIHTNLQTYLQTHILKLHTLKVVWHISKTLWSIDRNSLYNVKFMMANYKIVEFIAIMQHLIEGKKLGNAFSNQRKYFKINSGLYFCFLFLNWKVLSSKTYTVFV